MRTIWRLGIVMLVTTALLAASAAAATKRKKAASGPKADATLQLQTKSVAVGIGWSWGSGTLAYRGKRYPIKVDGLSVNAVGASATEATGYVYNLKNLADFEGTYTAIDVGGTLGGGKGIISMRNGNDVRITLHTTSRGIEAKAAPEGVKFTLED